MAGQQSRRDANNYVYYVVKGNNNTSEIARAARLRIHLLLYALPVYPPLSHFRSQPSMPPGGWNEQPVCKYYTMRADTGYVIWAH